MRHADARFPLAIERYDGGYRVLPVGDGASTRLIAWLARRDEPPPGFRLLRGVVPPIESPAVERPVTVDQTNRSVIVAERAVVKWMSGALRSPHPAPERLRRLMAAGFSAMPALWGLVEWQLPGGEWAPAAIITGLVKQATDGWTWCLAQAKAAMGLAAEPAIAAHRTGEFEFAAQLGELTAQMHLALADTPTGPVAVHGDFHVGQILRDGAGRLYVTDFDGNPTVSAAENVKHRPAAYDVAGMVLSLENVGHVVQHYHPDTPEAVIDGWVAAVQTEFLDAYRRTAGRLLDEALLTPSIEEQIHRELAYADAHLPEWRYVPEAALRRRRRQRQRGTL